MKNTLKDIQKLDPEKKKRLNALVNQVNKHAKKTVMAFANDVPNTYFERRPSGVMGLDIDCGGGLPAGGMSLLAGIDGAGKTMMLYQYMAMNQRIFGPSSAIALAPVEFLPDYFFMRKCGMQVAIPDDMIEQQQQKLENSGQPLLTKDQVKEMKKQVGDFFIIRGATGEQILDGVLAAYASKEFGIIGVDSFTAFQTDAEASTDSLEDNPRQAAAAGMLTRFVNRFHPLTLGLDGTNKTTLIGTCQVRANRDRGNAPSSMQKYIRAYTPSIPWALRHAMLVGLLLWPGEKVKEGSKESRKQTGKMICWETIKGKAGTHDGIRGETEFTYEDLTDNYHTIVQEGIAQAVLQENKGMFKVMRPLTGEVLVEKIPGVTTLIDEMKKNVEFEMLIRREILDAVGKSCTYW